MLGDWVSWTHDDITRNSRVSSIHKNAIFLDEFPQMFREYEIEPIPLTEEILKANGFFEYNPFETIDYKMYAFPEQCNIKKERGFGIEIGNGAFYITDHCLIPIIYVHNLQHALKQCGLSELADNFKIE